MHIFCASPVLYSFPLYIYFFYQLRSTTWILRAGRLSISTAMKEEQGNRNKCWTLDQWVLLLHRPLICILNRSIHICKQYVYPLSYLRLTVLQVRYHCCSYWRKLNKYGFTESILAWKVRNGVFPLDHTEILILDEAPLRFVLKVFSVLRRWREWYSVPSGCLGRTVVQNLTPDVAFLTVRLCSLWPGWVRMKRGDDLGRIGPALFAGTNNRRLKKSL